MNNLLFLFFKPFVYSLLFHRPSLFLSSLSLAAVSLSSLSSSFASSLASSAASSSFSFGSYIFYNIAVKYVNLLLLSVILL